MKRIVFHFLAVMALSGMGPVFSAEPERLPFEVRFRGREQFDKLLEQAREEDWKDLPIGKRAAAVGLALMETPYKSYTLEIDDHIEAPSVNLEALDCWTFFEVSLAFARMLGEPLDRHTPEVLLNYIELDRYRGGRCDGTYLSRLHYLADWLFDNQERGLVRDLSRDLGGVRIRRKCMEMSKLWKSYRYLRTNPLLLPEMRRHEDRISALPVYHVPKAKVAAVEKHLQDGDIIGITSKYDGAFCSHVGMARRDDKGVLRFMHASSKHGEVVGDQRLSDYLHDFRSHAGILVARPLK